MNSQIFINCKLPSHLKKIKMKIQVLNGVLVRKLHGDGTDAGFAHLPPGIYDALGPQINGFLRIYRSNTEPLFIAFEKLEHYISSGEIQILLKQA